MNTALRLSRSIRKSAIVMIHRKFNSAFSSKYLLVTNVALSTVSSLGGDLLAQNFEILSGEQKEFSVSRNVKVSITGTVVGPMFHYWYLFLDRKFPGRTARIIFTKVFLDMTVAPPIGLFLYFGSLGVMERESWDKTKVEMIEKGKELWLAEWMIWPPASAVAFYVLPTKFRVLFESSLSLIVDAYYSYVKFRDTDVDNAGSKGNENLIISKNKPEVAPDSSLVVSKISSENVICEYGQLDGVKTFIEPSG